MRHAACGRRQATCDMRQAKCEMRNAIQENARPSCTVGGFTRYEISAGGLIFQGMVSGPPGTVGHVGLFSLQPDWNSLAGIVLSNNIPVELGPSRFAIAMTAGLFK